MLRRHASKEDESMADQEMLTAMTDLLDQKLEERLELDMKYIRVVQLENVIIPRLNTIEQSYLDTSERYMEKTDQIDTMEQNIGVLKSVVQNHSDRLNRLSV